MLKEGLYEDFERRDALLGAGALQDDGRRRDWRSLKDYVGALKTNQTAIYYLAGDDIERLKSSPHLEGFRARGIEVLLLVRSGRHILGDVGARLRRQAVQVGDAGRRRSWRSFRSSTPRKSRRRNCRTTVKKFLVFVKNTLGDAVAEVRASERLTDSAVCLVASDKGPDRALEKLLAGAGRLNAASKPILEVNPRHRSGRGARARSATTSEP